MKTLPTLACLALLTNLTTMHAADTNSPTDAEKLGWTLAVHSYSFRVFTIFDAIDKTAALGIKHMSISGSVILAGSNSVTTVTLADKDMQAIKAKMISAGISWPFVNIGVVQLPPNEAESRKVFEFARKWEIPILVAEPAPEALDVVEKLCKEYNIKVAIHEHQRPNRYWDPAFVLAAIKDRGPLMGACADVGHWVRSGLDPVECLKKLDGHVLAVHFKDLAEKKSDTHDVPWGTGVCNSKGLLEELKRQQFHGAICVEYEYHWENNSPEIAQSVKFFNSTCAELAAPPAK
jgi:sugar phosphate isomerase/epimerase